MKNIKLTIEYDGSRYSGWQRQKNGISIEETVENAIKKIVNEEIKLIGASRTDSGVHAKGQVANFFTETRIPVLNMPSAFNSKLPADIVISGAEEVSADFHSRYSSIGKTYSYTIFNRRIPPAYMRNFMAHCPYQLDFDAMKSAACAFEGTHDFAAFRSTGGSAKTSVRTIGRVELSKESHIIVLHISADGFLYNMVRIIAGTLIDIGRGRIRPDTVGDIIESRSRERAGQTAPASGLCLEEIYY